MQHGFDTLGRLNAVDTKLGNIWDNNPAWQSVVSGVSYNAFGAITALTQLGVSETRQYNVLGQMTRMTKGSSIDVEYRFSATANDGKIVSQKNWLTGEDVTYQYDELERLISAATTNNTSWGLSFSYDGFGNRLAQSVTQGTGPVNTVLVNGNTNRISSSGYSYDANGNMTQMPNGGGSMTMNYDYSNRLATATYPSGSEDYKYAPDNRRIWRNRGLRECQGTDPDGNIYGWGTSPGEQVIFYSPGGQKMGVYCVSPSNVGILITAHEENVYFGARLVGKRIYQNGVTTVSAFTSDRLQSKGNGSAFYPYGESKTGAAGDDKEQFATYTRDAGTGLDYADQRWYASGLGRFLTQDPLLAYQSERAPSRYAYAGNDPVNYFDPEGLMTTKPVQYTYCVTRPETYRNDNGMLIVIAGKVECKAFEIFIDVQIAADPIQILLGSPEAQKEMRECEMRVKELFTDLRIKLAVDRQTTLDNSRHAVVQKVLAETATFVAGSTFTIGLTLARFTFNPWAMGFAITAVTGSAYFQLTAWENTALPLIERQYQRALDESFKRETASIGGCHQWAPISVPAIKL
ncbi:RHS repeat-associated core domain-containing protein [Bryobacter aggregatus]|uniref:RHS repeat-associated core domain-containing protein n=1 Tax=Bryobacter aggregatus TaxID=360054 RepID=UPI0004E1B86E|nr:RHS repeat-associated core domain-containing protein [Bryobacter aggregatus]